MRPDRDRPRRHLDRPTATLARVLLLVGLAIVIGLVVPDPVLAIALIVVAYGLSWLPQIVKKRRGD